MKTQRPRIIHGLRKVRQFAISAVREDPGLSPPPLLRVLKVRVGGAFPSQSRWAGRQLSQGGWTETTSWNARRGTSSLERARTGFLLHTTPLAPTNQFKFSPPGFTFAKSGASFPTSSSSPPWISQRQKPRRFLYFVILLTLHLA